MQNIIPLTLLLFTFPVSIRASWGFFSDPPQPSKIYFDWTMPINNLLQNGNETDKNINSLRNYDSKQKEGSKSAFPNIFYSIDLLVSNLTQLLPVTQLLDKNGLVESPLDLAFRVLDNDHLSAQRLGDVFYPFVDNIPVSGETLESFRKHISRIYINMRNASSDCPEANSYHQYKRHNPVDYDRNWGISLTKYSKRIADKLLAKTDNSVKVGVIYDENQFGCYTIAPQLKHADLLVINLNFVVALKFPLTYNQFKDYLENLMTRHRKNFLNELIPNANDIKIALQLNLDISTYDKLIKESYDWAELDLFEEIVDETRMASFSYLHKFAKEWARDGKSDLILSEGQGFNVSLNEWDMDVIESGLSWSMPYLHVQEVDVTPCQLRTMLGQMGSQFSSLVVSEYTWSAFARYANDMTATGCPKAIHPPVKPPTVYLLFTSGIGGMWKDTEHHFRNLLKEHQNIYGWHLTHLIFSGKDIQSSICRHQHGCKVNDAIIPDWGIPRFAMEMKEPYKIVCVVELSADNWLYKQANYFEEKTNQSCKQLWNVSSVIIWEFDVAWTWGLDDQLSFRLDGSSGIKSTITRASVARRRFIKKFPGKDVIFQINVLPIDYDEIIQEKVKKNYYNGLDLCDRMFIQLHNLYNGFQTWAEIHKMKVIFGPTYDLQEPIRGLWSVPEENGNPTRYNKHSCLKMITT